MSRLKERIENFNKAFELYQNAVKAYNSDKNDLIKMALIQSFEIVFELSWKVLRDYLKENGIEVFLPRQVIKEAFGSNLIEDGQIWINMLDDRNATSHEYSMDKTDLIADKIASTYFSELSNFKKGKVVNE